MQTWGVWHQDGRQALRQMATTLVIPYIVQKSLIFTAASSQYLTRTLTTPTSTTAFTFATWIKRVTRQRGMLIVGGTSSGLWQFEIETSGDDTILLTSGAGASPAVSVQSTSTIADTTTWHHIVLAVDTTQATAANRIHLYIDGAEVSYAGGLTYPTSNLATLINSANTHSIGGRSMSGSLLPIDALFSQTYLVDGQQLTPSSFVTGSGSGTTHPIAYTGGAMGINGFFLSYANAASTTTLGYDDDSGSQGSHAGSNDWTLNAMTTGNSSTDVPT